MKRLSRDEAEALLREAEQLNSGPWVAHSLNVARAAERIASADSLLDPDRAFALGCVHDIGRRFGITDMRHAYDGFQFLTKEGFGTAARVCLTHSFPVRTTDAASGQWDCSDHELRFVQRFLSRCRYTQYDRLIQLCDAVALPSGFCLIEKRLVDVAVRRGVNPWTLQKWRSFLALREFFDRRINQSIYRLLPGVVQTTFGDAFTD